MKFFLGTTFGVAVTLIGIALYPVIAQRLLPMAFLSPVSSVSEKPLDKFSIINLSSQNISASSIVIDEQLEKHNDFSVHSFHFIIDGPTSLNELQWVKKKITGIAHIPVGVGPFPVIVQLRGYVDPVLYSPGMGTRHSAEVFAANGFISLAPDFLGYGGSDKLTNDIFLDRFETYTTALSLLASIPTLSYADPLRIGIWGHSNGGQIALTVLEVLQKPIPASLWAPVTKPFPYSILYFTDDADDHGKFLRRQLAIFEQQYNVEKYSLTNYLNFLQSPIQLHQGTADKAVPQQWNDTFVQSMKDAQKDITYYVYSGADHDMNGSWNTVIARDIEFFKRYLKNQ